MEEKTPAPLQPNLNDSTVKELLSVGAAIATNVNTEVGGTPLLPLPAGWKVEDLSKYQQAPSRAKGTLSLASADDFARYVNKHKDVAGRASAANLSLQSAGTAQNTGGGDSQAAPTPDKDDLQTVILVDVINSKFRAVFNHHASDAPGWADFGATYDCPLSPEWQIWKGNSGKRMNQEEFGLFIEANQLDIVKPVGAEMLQIATTLKAKKDVAFESGIRLDNGQVQIKYHEDVKASGGGAGQLQIPEQIKLGIPVYVGGTAYEVTANFRYRIMDGGGLALWYDLVRPHKILEDALQKVIAQIETATGIETLSVTSTATSV